MCSKMILNDQKNCQKQPNIADFWSRPPFSIEIFIFFTGKRQDLNLDSILH